jgi:hypothetical protein
MRVLLIASLLVCIGSGCSSSSTEWTIAVENQSPVPCEIDIRYGDDGSRSARVDDLASGPAQVMVGESIATILQSVTITRQGEEQVLQPQTELRPGRRVTIVVNAAGVGSVNVSDN